MIQPELSARTRSSASRVPAHIVLSGFLEDQRAQSLLHFALSNEARFQPTTIGASSGRNVNPQIRVSSQMRDLGELGHALERDLRQLAPQMIAALGIGKFEISSVEIQLVAHGDGAFYSRHIDLLTGERSSDLRDQRMISCVCYFHAQPRGFSGGELRLYALTPSAAAEGEPDYAEIQPDHNTLVIFPSWAPHEVMPVRCSSGRFVDSRFAINCWICRKTPSR